MPDHDALRIRRAERRDLAAIVALLADDALGQGREAATTPLPASYAAAFVEIDADPRQFLLVAELDGAVVGTLQLTILPYLTYQGGRRAQIEAVRVHRDRRGQRLGERLFHWAIDEARRQGCHLVQLTTNAARGDAQRFYERLGFVASHVGMKLDLTTAAGADQ